MFVWARRLRAVGWAKPGVPTIKMAHLSVGTAFAALLALQDPMWRTDLPDK
jgi:hypothetical protein